MFSWNTKSEAFYLGQAVRNIQYFLNAMYYIKSCFEPSEINGYVSYQSLPDLINDTTNGMTVMELLQYPCEDELLPIIEDMEKCLSGLTDLFFEHQLTDACDRLIELRDILQNKIVD